MGGILALKTLGYTAVASAAAAEEEEFFFFCSAPDLCFPKICPSLFFFFFFSWLLSFSSSENRQDLLKNWAR